MNKRNIKYIVIHCTATPQTTTIESIKRYWKEQRGWGDTAGYHYIIEADGEVTQLVDEAKNSNGVYMHNSECLNIAYIGGIDKDGKPKDTRTPRQILLQIRRRTRSRVQRQFLLQPLCWPAG